MNKIGGLVLRNIMFMLVASLGIIAFAGIFISEMAYTYDDSNVTTEFAGGKFYTNASQSFVEVRTSAETMKNATEGGLGALVGGALDTAQTVLEEVFTSPVTFGNLVSDVLIDINVNEVVSDTIGYIIMAALYFLIAFAIVSAFLQGGKM